MVTRPVDSVAFAVSMTALGPFEPSPHIAVAVSGGSDSLALLLLLRDWMNSLGGRLTALTVDHGLRPEAAAECQRVAEIVAGLNADWSAAPMYTGKSEHDQCLIDHVILTWTGEKPASGLMAAARQARYRLLVDWCRAHDVLHLALGHHADDQAETILMRRHHGSGASGLAGMAGLRPSNGVRLLRPLLACRKSALQANVKSAGLAWIEDPSNRAERFERVRWRQHLGHAAVIAPVLAEGQQAGRLRDQVERRVAAWFAAHGRLDPAGYLVLPLAPLASLETEIAERVLAQAILAVGNADFAPAPAAVARLAERLREPLDVTTTLGGCLLVRRGDILSLFREAADCAGPMALVPEETILWDGRFIVTLRACQEPTRQGELSRPVTEMAQSQPLQIAAVGAEGLANRPLPGRLAMIAPNARPALPGLWQCDKLLTVGAAVDAEALSALEYLAIGGKFYKLDVSFRPRQPATSCGFTVVLSPGHTM